MSKLSDNAVEHFSKGYNCSQIVLGSFYEKYGMKQAAESGLFKKMCPIMIREAVEILEEMGY